LNLLIFLLDFFYNSTTYNSNDCGVLSWEVKGVMTKIDCEKETGVVCQVQALELKQGITKFLFL